jgi:ubiquitin-activating enzyme E1
MVKLVKTNILVLGLSGVGLELTKNIILAGPKSVTFWDTRHSEQKDLEWNYYLTQQEIENQVKRQDQILIHLQELNSYV